MAKQETITLQLKAKHFEGSTYTSSQFCAIAKAAKECFGEQHIIWEAMQQVRVGRKYYKHVPYNEADFDKDMITAAAHGFGQWPIREIQLTR